MRRHCNEKPQPRKGHAARSHDQNAYISKMPLLKESLPVLEMAIITAAPWQPGARGGGFCTLSCSPCRLCDLCEHEVLAEGRPRPEGQQEPWRLWCRLRHFPAMTVRPTVGASVPQAQGTTPAQRAGGHGAKEGSGPQAPKPLWGDGWQVLMPCPCAGSKGKLLLAKSRSGGVEKVAVVVGETQTLFSASRQPHFGEQHFPRAF